MAATKPIAQVEHFNPKRRRPRHQQTERYFRMQVKTKLLELLTILNPQDQIHFGEMSYEELVVYSRDWLQTECNVVSSDAVDEDRAAELELSPSEPTPLDL